MLSRSLKLAARRRITSRKCRRIALGFEVGNALFQLLNAVQQPTLAFLNGAGASIFAAAAGLPEFAFAVVGKHNKEPHFRKTPPPT